MDGWIDRRLPDFSSSTYCELNGLLDAVTLLTERRLNGVIISDSKSALLAVFSSRPTYDHVVQDILCGLANASDNSFVVSFYGCHLTWASQVMTLWTVLQRLRVLSICLLCVP